jgi:hypothetical protein
MIEPSPEMKSIFSETKIMVHNEDYFIVSISRNEEENARVLLKDLKPWSSITFDPEEVSIVLKDQDWNDVKGSFRDFKEEGPYRLLTFDIVLDLNLVGFLSVVSALLAHEDISIFAVSTYLRDHILVKKEDADKAVVALEQLINIDK